MPDRQVSKLLREAQTSRDGQGQNQPVLNDYAQSYFNQMQTRAQKE